MYATAASAGWIICTVTVLVTLLAIQPNCPAQQSDPAFSWSEDLFPILPWDPQHGFKGPKVDPEEGLESIAECGFTMAGFVLARDLPTCEALGLKAIMFPDVENASAWTRQWRGLSDEEIDERVRTYVEQSGQSDAIMGYYIVDEPGARDFEALGKAVAAVRKYAPGKLAYINLFPNYATVGAPDTSQLGTDTYMEHLKRFVDEVKPQLVSYDNYMTQVSRDMTEEKATARYYTNLIDIRKIALDNGLPFWNIVSCNQIRAYTTVPSPANLLLQAYTTLAAGGTGVSWYKYYSSGYGYAPIDPNGNRTPSWQYLQMVNQQLKVIGPMMNSLTSTGVYFTVPEPPGKLPRLPGKLVKQVGVETPVMVGEFSSPDGADYVMVVNLSLQQSACLQIDTAKEYSKRAFASPASGQWIALDDHNSLAMPGSFKKATKPGEADHRNGLWLAAGQGFLLRLEQ